MKLNKMVCPNCGHEFWTECAYGTCDACQTMFYAASSRECQPPPQNVQYISGPDFIVTPLNPGGLR